MKAFRGRTQQDFQLIAAAALLMVAALPAAAQTSVPSAKPLSEMTPAERAQRDADKVFQWIKLNADRAAPAPKAAAAPAPAPAAVARSKPASPAPAPTPNRLATATPAEAAVPAAPAVEPPTQLAMAAPTSTPPVTQPPATAPEPPAPEPELPLKLLVRVEPVLPRAVMASLDSGSVQLRFNVQPDGSVSEVETLRSSNKRLATAAVAAVAQWRFEPIPRMRSATVELGFNKE